MATSATNSELEQISGNASEGCIAPGLHTEVIAAGSAKTLVAGDSGAVVLLDTAAGSTVTLPAPVAGMYFDVAVSTSVTSNSHIVQTDAATTFIGGGINQIIDASGTSEGQFADPTATVTITMNGTTTGGLIGTTMRFHAISSTVWNITGLVASSGTLTTPFT